MKRNHIRTFALCAVLISGALLVGCADRTEKTPIPGEDLSENNESTSEDKRIPCVALSFKGGNEIFLPSETTESDISEALGEIYISELTEDGAEIKSISLISEFSLSDAKCNENEINEISETAEKLYRDADFTAVLIERENKVLDFKTVYENSSSHYEGTKVTKTEGKNGSAEVTFEATYSGKELVSREKTGEKTLTSPQNKVVLVGTKNSTASTGKYAWPTKNVYITSSYGGRTLNGKYDFHYGIDLRASVGTAIYASDGGKVIYTGRMGSYGILVKIEHDNGDVTYYAHLSSYSVKVGQRVYKGQQIAKSGSTGNVTGPHLHFEIRINGKHTNPASLLS